MPESAALDHRGIAHELNNFLAVVNAQSELLLERLEDAALRDRIVEIQKAVAQGATLTRQLLMSGREPAEAPAAETVAEPSRAGSERILLLDDQAVVRDVAAEMLRRKGYAVVVAEEPRAAVAEVSRATEPFDLLVTDMVMPAMSGSEVARQVAEISPLTRVLYISGYAPQFLAQSSGLSEESYLEKPFTSESLLRKVRSALDRARPAATDAA
jgi:two-component system, cell cycle sensor histidine kinase and response regulator CckA